MEQTRGETAVAKAVAREAVSAVEKLAQQQAKEREEERERKEAQEERLARQIQAMTEVLGEAGPIPGNRGVSEGGELRSKMRLELEMMEDYVASVNSLG